MPKKKWTFLTSHGAVLVFIATHTQKRAIDIATAVGLTERSVRRIISDLEAEGYIRKKRVGWSNQYRIKQEMYMRRPGFQDTTIGSLLQAFLSDMGTKRKPAPRK